MNAFGSQRLSCRVGEGEEVGAFFSRVIRAVHNTAKHADRAAIWWVHGDTSSQYGSPWLAILNSMLSAVEKPMIYLPALDIDSTGAQLVEHWFSLCDVHDKDIEEFVKIYDAESPDTLVSAMILKRSDIHSWRQMEPYSVSVALQQECSDILFMQVLRDNDAFEMTGAGELLKVFGQIFRRPL